MYYNMKSYQENQCVIISGESGAGKTEAAKRIMQYIASVSGESSSNIQKIKDMVLATNPLLESFGCAKTLRNNNSSRHGKYLQIQFNRQGEPIGANITNYLLEKARVVGQIRNERNFHIFYQLTKGASQQQRELYGIQMPDAYSYTSASKCVSVDGIDDISDFKETIRAMEIIGLNQNEQDQIFRLLSAILWIGNIEFSENSEGNAAIRDASIPNFVAYLLEVNAADIEKALTERIVETSRGIGRRGSVYEVPLNPVQARAVRDALAKAIYNNLFDWIVERLNLSLEAKEGKDKSIGILDIYGFEIFENNSFEQLCINYVNEKLQQIFIQLTLKTEQEEYVREQIKWTPIDYFNNKIVCDLIEEKRPPGIFAALNDSIATAHADSNAADQNFAQRLSLLSSNPHFDQRQSKFLIKHYAGDVLYDINGMTDKNKDQLLKDLLILISKTGNQFLHTIFPQQVDTDSRRRPPTAGDKIKISANDLMNTLSKSQPSYIRTIKPNQTKNPLDYDSKMVLHQVKYLGLHENVRIRRAGFAYRQTFEKFTERFYLLSGKTSYAGDFIWKGDNKTATLEILRDTGIPQEEYQMGTTKVFIKTPETLFSLEHMRDMYWHNMAARIQRAWRRFQKRKIDAAIKIQRAWRQQKDGDIYMVLRDKGHKVLNGRKERRRLSLNGYRRFMGDYLGCNEPKSAGGFMARAVGLNETTIFSMTGETLHSKFGRSSQRVPRTFILTRSKLLIIANQVVNRQLTVVVERSIPVPAIKYIAMSNLRDDWLAISVQENGLPDPFISCLFKTELVTQIKQLRPGLELRVGPTVQYYKKPGKITTIKFQTDSTAGNEDFYKSSTVHVGPGCPPNSVSDPTPKKARKPGSAAAAGRTTGTRPPPTRRNIPAVSSTPARPPPPAAPTARRNHPPPPPPSSVSHTKSPLQMPTPFGGAGAPNNSGIAAAAANAAYNPGHTSMPSPSLSSQLQSTSIGRKPVAPVSRHTPSSSISSTRSNNTGFGGAAASAVPPASRPTPTIHVTPAPPPPPPVVQTPPPPAPPAEPLYKALYDFSSTETNQLSVRKDEVVVMVQKGNEGWCLVKRNDGSGAEGWAPVSYLEEIKQVSRPTGGPTGAGAGAAGGRRTAPAPPSKSNKPSTLNNNNNNNYYGNGTGGTSTPASVYSSSSTNNNTIQTNGNGNGGGLAMGLADALKQKNQQNNALAGGLAEALKARTGRKGSDDEDDDDW